MDHGGRVGLWHLVPVAAPPWDAGSVRAHSPSCPLYSPGAEGSLWGYSQRLLGEPTHGGRSSVPSAKLASSCLLPGPTAHAGSGWVSSRLSLNQLNGRLGPGLGPPTLRPLGELRAQAPDVPG